MKVSRIVDTMIGEGLYAGYPCTLVRLRGCNLSCSYCDVNVPVPDEWTGTDINPSEEMTVDQIIESLRDNGQRRMPWILLTGGEPLIDPNTPELLERMLEGGWNVLVETNGTQDISVLPVGLRIAMDVKTPSSGMEGKHLVSNIQQLGHGDEIRFVCTDDWDIDYAIEMIHGLETAASFSLSPVWNTIEPRHILQKIMDSGLNVRLNLQLHKILGVA